MVMMTIFLTMMVDLNESEGHGDQAETEVGHGEVGDEHVPKRNNNYSQPISGWFTQEQMLITIKVFCKDNK